MADRELGDLDLAETPLVGSDLLAVSRGGVFTKRVALSEIFDYVQTLADDAESSADDTAALYDAFDDRYLGDKAADPALDNDSDALLTGALYWNTVSDRLKVYNGSSWDDPVADALAAQAAAETAQSAAETAQANAETAETNAETAETNAETAETNAETAQAAAEAAQAAAELALDNFDDRYLGAKAADPALDNDSEALLTGALYWNTVTDRLKVYNGSSWDDPVTDAESAQTAAEAAQSAAEAAQTATEGVYDQFDDRYLGSSSSDPALDNDSEALIEGALYWNDVSNRLKVYNGSTWTDPVSDAVTAQTAAEAAQTAAETAETNAETAETAAQGYADAAARTALFFEFDDSTTDSDPGNGAFRFNNADPASTTVIYLDLETVEGSDVTAWIATFDDSTTVANRGELTFVNTADASIYAKFYVNASNTTATGYRKINVTYVDHNGTFTDTHEFSLAFARTGDKGLDGAGSGDVVGPASAVDGNVALFDSTTGKLIQDGGFAPQPVDAELTALAGLTSAADKLPYFDGSESAALADFTTFARTLLDDANASAARTTLGVVIDSDVQAYDAGLASIAGLTTATDKGIYTTALDTYATFDLTSFGRSLLDDADASTARSTLGVAIGSDVQAYDATLAALAGLTIAANSLTVGTGADAFSQVTLAANRFLARSSGGSLEAKTITDFGLSLLDDADASAARTTLGLGSLAEQSTVNNSDWSGTDLAIANGGTGGSTASAARTNLGLVIGTDVQAQDSDLQALADNSSNGLWARTSAGNGAARSLASGGGIAWTNGDGVSGNPTPSINNTKALWIPAAAMTPAATNGAESGSQEAPTNDINYGTLAFDASTDEFAHFNVAFPNSWNRGTITAEFIWTADSTSTNSVVWTVQGGSISDNGAIDTAFGTAQSVTDANGSTALTMRRSAETSAVTIAGSPADGDWCYFRVSRDADNGSDNLAADALLIGIRLFYTVDTLDDA